jgi:hypothetical protein
VPNISGQDERGLLGLAFDPDYRTNGYIYLDYINLSSDTIIARYTVSSDPDSVDPATAYQIMFIDQPFSNHNGGTLLFGPDRYLYIGMGDGGGAGDAANNGQRDDTLLGKMLRIDIRSDDFPLDPAKNYAIPPSNPHAAPGLPLDEIWAKGMRNPYRWSFDSATGDIYIGDVGQNAWEEVDFGRPVRRRPELRLAAHGRHHCYKPPSNCDPGGLTLPDPRVQPLVRPSITGGYVYRGSFIPGLAGTYFFSDFCTSTIWSFRCGRTGDRVHQPHGRAPPGGACSSGRFPASARTARARCTSATAAPGTDGEVYKIKTTDSRVSAARRRTSPSRSPRPARTLHHRHPLAVELTCRPAHGGRLRRGCRLVRTSSRPALGAGGLSLVWDGASGTGTPSPSGIYFLRAEVDGQALTQRLGSRDSDRSPRLVLPEQGALAGCAASPFRPPAGPRSRRRIQPPHRRPPVTTGTTTRVRRVEAMRPPITARAIGARNSAPAPRRARSAACRRSWRAWS